MSYTNTRIACYIGYVTQAIVNNLSPLLFATFGTQFGISLSAIAALIIVNFCIQIAVDLSSAFFIDRLGYRASMVLAHSLSAAGLSLMSVLPFVLDAYAGLIVCTALSALGGGLLEVAVSPIVEALPTGKKSAAMAILHSFYCWGQAAVVLLATLFFTTVGIDSWRLLPPILAFIPFANAFLFLRVPICTLEEANAAAHIERPKLPFYRRPFFYACIVLMLCAGAIELTVSQWSSYFAEIGLAVDKRTGDLLGPFCFALLMGFGRLLYGLFGTRLALEIWLALSGALGIFSYLLIALAQNPVLSLVGCMLAGLAAALLWPGTYSLGSAHLPGAGTKMFALFALAGDIGCSAGPSLAALVSDSVSQSGRIPAFLAGLSADAAGLRLGFLSAAVFPLILLVTALVLCARRKKIA